MEKELKLDQNRVIKVLMLEIVHLISAQISQRSGGGRLIFDCCVLSLGGMSPKQTSPHRAIVWLIEHHSQLG